MTLSERVSTCQFLLRILDSVSVSALLLLTTHIAQPQLLLHVRTMLLTSGRKKKELWKVTLSSYSLAIGFLNNLEMDVFWEKMENI